jgi:uncharacterized protein involved in exopolysaccharide biosynthesis
MELKEFFEIFVIHKKMFWSIIMISIIVSVIFYFLQPQTYKTILTMNITRGASTTSNNYTYDDFYRLQADERFADTVVRWIQSPFILSEIVQNIEGVNNQKIKAKRLSSQVLETEYVTHNKEDANKVSQKLIKLLNQESENLNIEQKQDNWFIILGSKPIITDNTKSLIFLVALGSFIGFFVAFWVVIIKHYITISDK